MSSIQGVVLATAMLVSSTVLYLAFSKQKTSSPPHPPPAHQDQNLRSCLRSEEKKKLKKKEKKRVQFAANVKDTKGNGKEYRKEKEKSWFARRAQEQEQEREKEKELKISAAARVDRVNCREEIQQSAGGLSGIPANRIALYNGILRDRVHRMECSSY